MKSNAELNGLAGSLTSSFKYNTAQKELIEFDLQIFIFFFK